MGLDPVGASSAQQVPPEPPPPPPPPPPEKPQGPDAQANAPASQPETQQANQPAAQQPSQPDPATQRVQQSPQVAAYNGQSSFEAAPARSKGPELWPSQPYGVPGAPVPQSQNEASSGPQLRPGEPPPVQPGAAKPQTQNEAASAPPPAPPKTPDDYNPSKATDGKEAGARLADQQSPRYADAPDQRAKDLTQLSQEHPDWMKDAYGQLPPDQSADLIGQSVRNISADNLTDQQKADQVQALGNGFSQANVTDQVSIAQAAAVDPTRANAMGLVLKQQGPSDAARTAFVDATWDKASAKTGDYQTPLYARATMDALSGSQDLVDARLASDPNGMVQAMTNGRQVEASAYANNVPALKSDGLEKVVGMAGNYHGEGAAKVHADIFTTLGKELGDKPDPAKADLVKGLSDLYVSNAGELGRSIYNPGPYRTPKNAELIPKVIQSAMFDGQDPEFGAKLGKAVGEMSQKDPVGAGMTMQLVQQGYERASSQLSADKEARGKLFDAVSGFTSAALGVAAPEATLLIAGLGAAAKYAFDAKNTQMQEGPQEQIATMNMLLQDAAEPNIPEEGRKSLSQEDNAYLIGSELARRKASSTKPVK